MVFYNTTQLETARGFGSVFIELNALAGGIIVPLLLISVGAITFLSMTNRGYQTTDTAVSTLMLLNVLAFLFWSASSGALLAFDWVIMLALLLLISVFIQFNARRG